jgi:hypothetical protein
LGVRIGLSLGVILLLLGLLEFAARLVMPSLAPVYVRDGFYDNPLPLVTSTAGPPIDLAGLPSGQRLPEAKRTGETRIFMMGESSVAGSPLGIDVSPPAMLKDLLSERLPGRDLTVVNMGRPASICANVYYYLLFLRRFAPDFVVFFMGVNDSEHMPGEQCLPGSHPGAYGLWRSLVERSWLLWLTRVYGPQFVWKATGKSDWYPARDCPEPTFSLWTDLLVGAAIDAGARVVIATPVVSAVARVEPVFRGVEHDDRPLDDDYRELLACALTDGCDFPGRVRATLGATTLPPCDPEDPAPSAPCAEVGASARDMLALHRRDLDRLASAWEGTAQRLGAEYIPFHRRLEEASPGTILASAFFMDRQHLTPTGYYYLARLVSERIAALLTGGPERAVSVPLDADVKSYVRGSASSGVEVELEQLVRTWFLTGLPGLRFTAENFVGDECSSPRVCDEGELARVALGWLRIKAGLEPGLPPELAARAASFTPRAALDALRRAKFAPSTEKARN